MAVKPRDGLDEREWRRFYHHISFIEGIVGEPVAAAYNASKGEVRIFTKLAALHCADNGYDIRVNSGHLGFFPTPMLIGGLESMPPEQGAAFQQRIEKSIPLKRVGDLDDIAYGVGDTQKGHSK